MLADPRPIREHRGDGPAALSDALLASAEPVVLRGLVAHWPMVAAARQSIPAAVAYLRGFERADAPPVVATVGPPGIGGRVFYNDDLSGINFRQEQIPLRTLHDTQARYAAHAAPPLPLFLGARWPGVPPGRGPTSCRPPSACRRSRSC